MLNSLKSSLSTTPILRTFPPPDIQTLLTTIKDLFPQFLINLIMRITHPVLKVLSRLHSRLIPLCHPTPEIIRTMPTRIKPSQRLDKRRNLPLLLR